jgi:hypothetical protein
MKNIKEILLGQKKIEPNGYNSKTMKAYLMSNFILQDEVDKEWERHKKEKRDEKSK